MATKPRRIDGVDISHHQSGAIDLERAERAGVRFLYHKSTEGAGFRDARYADRRREAKRAGLPFGAYHFARPENGDASIEARFFLRTAQPQPGDLVPALDLEVNDAHMSRAALTRWVADWVAQIQRAVHVKPIIYTPFDLDSDCGCLLWQPRYNNSNTPPAVAEPWKRWDIWQFSNGQLGVPNQVPGFGRVDINTMRDELRVREFRIPVVPVEPKEPTRMGPRRFVTQNVKALPLMPQGLVVDDVNLTASQADVIGWQEIGITRYDEAVMALDSNVWEHFFAGMRRTAGYESPISFRKDLFRKVEGDAMVLSDPESGISKRKYFTWLVLEDVRTGAHILITNKHYIAGAWRKDKPDKKERQEIWRQSRDEVELPFLREFIKTSPDTAIANFGDYNAQLATGGNDSEEYPRKIGNRTIYWLTRPSSIDQIMLINGKTWKWQIDDEDGELLPGRNSDHQGRQGTAGLKKVTK